MVDAERVLTGRGRTAPSRARVVHPETSSAVAALLADVGPRGVVARGLGRSYADAAQNAGGTVADLTGLDDVRTLDLEAGEITVGAGVSLDRLLRALVPLGWFPMVVPGTAHVTVGGAIASDIHGKNHRDGSFCDHVRSFRLETPARGAVTVDPEGEPELFWATAGGMGLTGMVTEATLALQRIETGRMRVDTERASDLDDLLARMDEGDHRYQYTVAWIDCVARGPALGRAVLTRGDHARGGEVASSRRSRSRAFESPTLLTAPPWFPNGLVNPATVRAFNELWFRKAPRREHGRIEKMGQFFFPLDVVDGWNRVYGTRGFVQYQFVVPYGAEAVLQASLERLSGDRVPSFLAVIKRFERGNPGPLSFPRQGWTLAVDVPTGRPELVDLFDDLDDLVVAAGGRVYLSKDARVRPELVPAMYPELDRWRAVQHAIDPDRRLRSDLARRLGLLEPETSTTET